MSLPSDSFHRSFLVREAEGVYRGVTATEVLDAARAILEAQFVPGLPMTSPAVIKDYLRHRLGGLEHEVFGVLFFDAQMQLIEYREMFRGTLTQTSVYPREVLKAALAVNAGSVVLVHNHPSGQAEPSRADELLTSTLANALRLVDVRVHDHFIVARATVLSFAEQGLI